MLTVTAASARLLAQLAVQLARLSGEMLLTSLAQELWTAGERFIVSPAELQTDHRRRAAQEVSLN